MRLDRFASRFALLISLLPALLLGAFPAQAAPQAAAPAGDPAFDRVWSRTDQLVRAQNVQRSWMWGEYAFARLEEPFAGAPGGVRLVEYYDKSRMEINDPNAGRTSEWFVTNGLLVKELMSGLIVKGMSADQVEQREPAQIPVAGDAVEGNPAPTYAELGNYASIVGGAAVAPNRVGSYVVETLDQDGTLGTDEELGVEATRLGTFVPEVNHNIPDVFWNYLNMQGQLLDGKFLQEGTLFNWVYVMGYPITEPYWIRASIGGQVRTVLVQAFERRILTWNPTNAAAWQVEMGNVGRAYYDWRYGAEAAGTLAPPVIATRIVIPQAGVDAPIVPTYVEGQQWQVASNAVGWLYGTSLPGLPGNSVFSGHNNAQGEVFRELEQLALGDQFTLYTSDGATHTYQVTETTKVREQGANLAQLKDNARYMQNTPDERVTLISCWPYETSTHRLIVIAKPVR